LAFDSRSNFDGEVVSGAAAVVAYCCFFFVWLQDRAGPLVVFATLLAFGRSSLVWSSSSPFSRSGSFEVVEGEAMSQKNESTDSIGVDNAILTIGQRLLPLVRDTVFDGASQRRHNLHG